MGGLLLELVSLLSWFGLVYFSEGAVLGYVFSVCFWVLDFTRLCLRGLWLEDRIWRVHFGVDWFASGWGFCLWVLIAGCGL